MYSPGIFFIGVQRQKIKDLNVSFIKKTLGTDK